MESDAEEDEIVFLEWLAAGARIGFEAFFAVFVFLLCSGVVLGVLALVGSLVGGDGE